MDQTISGKADRLASMASAAGKTAGYPTTPSGHLQSPAHSRSSLTRGGQRFAAFGQRQSTGNRLTPPPAGIATKGSGSSTDTAAGAAAAAAVRSGINLIRWPTKLLGSCGDDLQLHQQQQQIAEHQALKQDHQQNRQRSSQLIRLFAQQENTAPRQNASSNDQRSVGFKPWLGPVFSLQRGWGSIRRISGSRRQ